MLSAVAAAPHRAPWGWPRSRRSGGGVIAATAAEVGGGIVRPPILLNVMASVLRTDLTAPSFTSAAPTVMTRALPVLAWQAPLSGSALIRRDA